MREHGLTVVLVKAHEQKLVLLLAREIHYTALAAQRRETAAARACGVGKRQSARQIKLRVKRICCDTPSHRNAGTALQTLEISYELK